MGMFDYVYVDYKLPDEIAQKEQFQTKSMHRLLDNYYIAENGQLYFDENDLKFPEALQNIEELTQSKYTGEINFYTSLEHKILPEVNIYDWKTKELLGHLVEHVWYDYCAVFEKGMLTSIEKQKKDLYADCNYWLLSNSSDYRIRASSRFHDKDSKTIHKNVGSSFNIYVRIIKSQYKMIIKNIVYWNENQ